MKATVSNALKTVNITTISNVKCVELLNDQRKGLISATNVCTGAALQFGGEGTPLLGKSSQQVVAISSVIFDELTNNDIYTLLGSYVTWINEITGAATTKK